MSKDPAILFYTSDFLIGTEFFTDDQVGKYIRALCKQHQHGYLTLDQLNQTINNDTCVLSKFKQDENGLFYNQRMDDEIKRRKKYGDSRRKNIMKRWHNSDKPLKNKRVTDHTYVIHMENENENENEDINRVKKSAQNTKPKKVFIPPTFEEFLSYCKENRHAGLAERAFKGYEASGWIDSTGKPVKCWKSKLQHVWFRPDNLDPPEQIKKKPHDEVFFQLCAKNEKEMKEYRDRREPIPESLLNPEWRKEYE